MVEILSQLTDEEIVLLIQNGDKEKFAILMSRYEAKLSRYGKKFLSNTDSIGDIVQDVFISTFQNMNSFNSSLKFSSWIYRIAHNAFVNELKKHQKRALPYFNLDTLISHEIYEDPLIKEKEYEEIKLILDESLEELEAKYKEVLLLHYIEEFSYKEISDILEIPTSTVGVRIKRGKETLKKIYEKKQYGKQR